MLAKPVLCMVRICRPETGYGQVFRLCGHWQITYDTLDWYGWDDDGGSVHDVIGTRCDPYTAKLLADVDYHHCCHSNLIRALAAHHHLDFAVAEPLVHDVLTCLCVPVLPGIHINIL